MLRVSRNRKRIAALLMVAAAVGMTIGARRVAGRAQAMEIIADAPPQWVPFTADVEITKPAAEPVVGRFFRSSDGSRRLETGPAPGDMQVIFIANAATGNIYIRSRTGAWTVQTDPSVTPGHYQPTRSMPMRPDWGGYPYKLAIRRGQSGSLSAAEGFRAYQLSAPDGSSQLIVPELNLFTVQSRNAEGRVETYRNIQGEEPATTLFLPPADARIGRLSPRQPRQ